MNMRIRRCRYPHCTRALLNTHRLTRYCVRHRLATQREHKLRTWNKRKHIYRPDNADDH